MLFLEGERDVEFLGNVPNLAVGAWLKMLRSPHWLDTSLRFFGTQAIDP